jgi:transposase
MAATSSILRRISQRRRVIFHEAHNLCQVESTRLLNAKVQVPAPRLVGVELNPGPSPRRSPRQIPRLTEEQRWRVIHLSTEMHLSPAQIARRMTISRQTVYSLLQKYSETKSIRDRAGRGRKRKMTKADEKKVMKKARKEKGAPEIVRELKKESGLVVGEDTVRRVIREHKLRYLVKLKVQELSDANKAKRMQYAIAMQGQNWKQVFFSDEKTFYLGSMTDRAKVKTLAGLKRKLNEEWRKMPWAVIRRSVATMPARLAECRKLQGGRTHY